MSASAESFPAENMVLLDQWKRTLARRGPDPAVMASNGAILRTFLDIEAEAQDLETHLYALPFRSVVAVKIRNSPSWPAVLLALLRRGHIPLPMVEDARTPHFANGLVEAGLRVTQISEPSPAAETIRCAGSSTALLKLSSGTTGAPRAIRFTASQIAADCHQVCDTMQISGEDLNFGVVPFAHSYGFSNLVTPLLLRGVPLVASEDRFPRAVLDGLACSGATVFPGAPILFDKLAEIEGRPLPQLRLVISAGAPLTRAVWTKFHARFGLKLHTFYGSSECGGIAYDRSGDLPTEGFIGQPMERVEILTESGNRICVRSAAVAQGYFPEEDPAILGGGSFRPGDVVERIPEGLILAGRESDFINVAGRKLNPAHVELVLTSIPGVQHATVFGVPSELRGEEPVACIVGDIPLEVLLRAASRTLAAWELPRDFWFVPEAPANERGKINRRALASRYVAERRTPISRSE